MTDRPVPRPPAHRPERPDSAGQSLDVRLAEVGQDLRRLEANRRQQAAACRAAATRIRDAGEHPIRALDTDEQALALAALLEALASGSASHAIRRRAYLLAQALTR